AVPLGREAALDGPARRPGGAAALRRRGARLAQQPGEAVRGRVPVAELGAVLGGDHREHAAGEPGREPPQGERLQLGAQRGGGGDVEAELDPAVGGVDALPADRKSTRLNSSHVKISYAVSS